MEVILNELVEKILEALFAEALAGVLVDSGKGLPTRIVARVRGFRGWRRVKPALVHTEPTFAQELEEIIVKKGLWHWHWQHQKEVRFTDPK